MVHGWGGHPGEHWAPWVRKQLEALGYEVLEPAMPDTDAPNIDAWEVTLAETVGRLDSDTYFIGHSVGCQAILRYLARQEGARVGGCVFVAGWFKLAHLEPVEVPIAEPWLAADIDFKKILATTNNFIVINSSNDDYNFVEENKKMFKESLGAQVTILPNKGHFTTADGVTTLPEVVTAIQNLNN